MRAALLVSVLLIPSIVSAQPQPADALSCTPVVREVVVTASDGGKQKDTLLCMSTSEIVLAKGGTVALDRVRKIEEPADGILDGVLKGAAFGLVILAFCVNDCDAGMMLRATAAYATIGGLIDALDRNRKPIYSADRTVALAWKVRF